MSDSLREALPSNRDWLAEDIWLSIPGYLRKSIQKAHEGDTLRASTDAAPVADWIGPVPCDGSKPDWLPDNALCMIAYNPLESQNAMTWEFAEKRAKPVRDRDWDGVTAFCFKPLAHPPVPDAAPVAGKDVSLVKARRIVDTVTEFCRGSDFSCDMKAATKAILPLLKAIAHPPATNTEQAEPTKELLDRAEVAWQRFFYPARDCFMGETADLKPSVGMEMADCLRLVLAAVGREVRCPTDGPISAPAEPVGHWLEPYRSMDASGSPEAAGNVGHQWLTEIARAENENDPGALGLETQRPTKDGSAQILYRGTKALAAFFVVRDPMNFAVLFRYRAGGSRIEAEPVGLREIVERFCDWVARADDETDDCDYLNGYHPDQMIDERDGWDDLRDIRDSALAVLSTPPARTDEGEG